MSAHPYPKGVVRIGIVAYAPKVVTIWEGIKEYLRGQGFNADWILYSNYPALVEATKGYQELEDEARELNLLS